MAKRQQLVPAAVLLFTVAMPGRAGTKPAPLDLLFSSSDSIREPLWLSARELSGDQGRVAWERLDPLGRKQVERNIEGGERYLHEKRAEGKTIAKLPDFAPKIAVSDCTSYALRERPYTGDTAPQSFAGLVEEAEGILAGRITAIESGFLQGLPASLLEVQVAQAFRPLRDRPASHKYLLFHPFARFALGGHSFCNAEVAPWAKEPAFEPEVGARVILFVFGKPLDREGILLTPLPEQIVYESPKGELRVARKLERDDEVHPAKTFAEIEELLRKALRQRLHPERPPKPQGDALPSHREPNS